MKTLSDLLVEYLDHTSDNSSTNSARGKRRMNERQRTLLAGKNYWFIEKETVIATVADQQEYNLPLDCLKVSSVRVTVDDVSYILDEIPSDKKFDMYNMNGIDVTSDFPLYYNIRDGKVLLYPIPSNSGNDITILYQLKPRDMTLEDYTTGTIAVTNNSATVTGTATSWSSTTILPGAAIFIRDVAYEILTVNSTTSITLTRPYEGTTGSGLSYTIGDIPSIPEEFSDVLWLGAVADYWLKKESKTYVTYKNEYGELEGRLRIYGQSKTNDQVINKHRLGPRTTNDYPFSIG